MKTGSYLNFQFKIFSYNKIIQITYSGWYCLLFGKSIIPNTRHGYNFFRQVPSELWIYGVLTSQEYAITAITTFSLWSPSQRKPKRVHQSIPQGSCHVHCMLQHSCRWNATFLGTIYNFVVKRLLYDSELTFLVFIIAFNSPNGHEIPFS